MLLLDEMLPATIAERLTRAGCNTDAVVARVDLRGAPDDEVLQVCTRERRVLVTCNISDFVALIRTTVASGRTHAGIVLVSTTTFPMDRHRTKRITQALAKRHREGRWPGPGQFEFLQRKQERVG